MKQKLFTFFGLVLVLLAFFLVKPTKADAAITFRAAASGSTGSACGTTSWTINVPTGTLNGDVMIAAIQHGNATLTPPAGWTLINSVSNTGLTANLKTYYRVASSEPASYTWSLSVAVCNVGTIVTYTGVNGTPVDVNAAVADNVSQTSHIASAVTTTAAPETILTAFAGYDTTCGTGSTWTAPAGQTLRSNANNASCRSMGMNDSSQASIGSSGTFTGTVNAAGTALMSTIALKQANTAPTFSGAPAVFYQADMSRASVNATPWILAFTPTDAEQTGANALTYYVYTGANRTGTQVATGTTTSGSYTSVNIAYNALGMVNGSNTFYVSLSDGSLFSSDSSITVLRDDVAPTAATSISTTPNPVTSTSYTVTFTPHDAASTALNEMRYQIRTGSGGTGTLLVGNATYGDAVTNASAKTTASFTDSTLAGGANTRYIRTRDGANNWTDTSFTVTYSPTASNVTTSAPSGLNSYYTTLNGSANPNGYATTGHFRVFTTNPGNCNSDTGGTGIIRYPALSANDPALGSGSTVANFSYTIPFNGTFLTPNTTYYYCSYAINANGTTGATSVTSFFTPFGPSSPCDAPMTGNLSLPAGASCTFPNATYDGVDAGSGTTNTASISLASQTSLTIGAGQKAARGSVTVASGGTLTVGQGGTLQRSGIFVHDADGDGVLDDSLKYIGTAPAAGYVRRTAFKAVATNSAALAYSSNITPIALFDCDGGTNPYTYRNIPNLVKDADHDGYKTAAAAATQCVGASAVFNGRTYYNDGSGPN